MLDRLDQDNIKDVVDGLITVKEKIKTWPETKRQLRQRLLAKLAPKALRS
jgi:hypothetical protein